MSVAEAGEYGWLKTHKYVQLYLNLLDPK